MAQVRCPNCGGYKTVSDHTLGGSFLVWIYFFIAVFIGLMLGILHWAAGVISFFVVLVLLLNGTNFKYNHYCNICGFRWKS